jgi:PAS domain S-box-containing protein
LYRDAQISAWVHDSDDVFMPHRGLDERVNFLSQLPARPIDYRLALAAAIISGLIFAVAVPFAKVQLPAVWAFIPSYQSALATNDLITAVLLYAQFGHLRSRALLLLASGYLFTTLMAVVHALTFPGLFTPTGLLGASPQSTAWLYMFWHGGFPLLVIGYGLMKDRNGAPNDAVWPARRMVAASIAAVTVAVAVLASIATVGNGALPAIMSGHNYTPILIGVISTTWFLSLVALAVLCFRRPHSVLDIWLMLVMVSWLFDIALSGIFNAGRFDLGFYAGRLYGLAAASFILIVLLLETAALYAQLAHAFRERHQQDAAEISRINARLSTVLESSPLPIFSLDGHGFIASWNGAAERIFGCAAADVIGRSFSSLHQAGATDLDQALQRVMGGETLRDLKMQWPHRDGRTLEVVYAAAPIPGLDTQISGAVYVAEDVTDKLKLERQLAQSQKMEAVGQLTGGIAHDFNNILTVITGTVEILHDELADRPRLAVITKMIDEAAMRGAELTKGLLAFARKQPLQPRETDLNNLVVDAAKLLHPTLGEQIEIESILSNDAWPALIDPSQLTSALLNLSINARDAMPDGGQLTLETRNVFLDEAYAKENSEVIPGPYVMIAVSDTGAGIPVEIRDKVFDPFFTTKAVGQGTGLGLSMVFGFIKQSGGHIKIYSEVGHGTAVKMYLPRALTTTATVQDMMPIRARGGDETILVVEDDPLVRGNVVMQLASLGYKTLEAATGPEALRLIDGNGVGIDLLFTDVVIPGGMNGRQLADEIAHKQPSIKVLYTSGYTQNAIVHQGRLDPGVLLLGKPYRKMDLARMVRVALD